MSSGPVRQGVEPLDKNGNRITLHCRVHVPERPSSLITGFSVPAFGGIVEKIEVDPFWNTPIVTVREFRNWNIRTVRPEECKVQHGRTKTSDADAAARAAAKSEAPKRRRRKKTGSGNPA